MPSILVQILVMLLLVYILVGMILALFFLKKGLARLDEASKEANWPTRMLWLPAVVLLWPVLCFRSFQQKKPKI